MNNVIAYINGEFLPECQVKIDPMDRGFYVGDAVFDIARTYAGKPFKLREHIERLYRSLKYVRIDPGIDIEEMLFVSEELVRMNEAARLESAGDWFVWQTVTRGVAPTRADIPTPTVLVVTKPVPWNPWGTLYKNGAKAVITKTRAYPAQSLDPKIKHYSRMNFNLAELEAKDVDQEALPILLDLEGNISEGTGYNVAIAKDGVIITPKDDNILKGISRQTMFDMAQLMGISVVEENLQPYDLYTADEVFFVTTTNFIFPVTVVDKRSIGDGKQGPIVKQLLAAFSEKVGMDIVAQMERYAAV